MVDELRGGAPSHSLRHPVTSSREAVQSRGCGRTRPIGDQVSVRFGASKIGARQPVSLG
jgi:hypothetical protein